MQTKVTIAVILAVFAAFAFFAWQHTKTDLSIPEGMHGYESSTYQFSFEAPARYNIKTFTDSLISVGDRTGDGGFSSISEVMVIEAGGESYASFAAFIESQLMLLCAADGAEASVSCTGVASSEPFEAIGGLSGTSYVLTEETRSLPDEEVTSREVGPFYVFDISSENPGKGFVAVVVYAPITEPKEGSEEVAEVIAYSIETPTYRTGIPSDDDDDDVATPEPQP